MCRVKICGIKSVHEGKLADRLGADALGLLVGQIHTSDDFISPQMALEICTAISPYIVPVLVTHLEDPGSIVELAGIEQDHIAGTYDPVLAVGEKALSVAGDDAHRESGESERATRPGARFDGQDRFRQSG